MRPTKKLFSFKNYLYIQRSNYFDSKNYFYIQRNNYFDSTNYLYYGSNNQRNDNDKNSFNKSNDHYLFN